MSAKYSTSFFVIIFSSITQATSEVYDKSTENPFFYLWIISAIISSFCAYGWDIWMDFGLMKMEGENRFLRDEIVYSSTVSLRLISSFSRILILFNKRKKSEKCY